MAILNETFSVIFKHRGSSRDFLCIKFGVLSELKKKSNLVPCWSNNGFDPLFWRFFEYLLGIHTGQKSLGKPARVECLEWIFLHFFSLCISLCPGFHFGFSFENLGQTNLKVCHMKAKPTLLPHPQISFHDNLVKKTFCQLIKRGKGIESRQGYSINAKNGRCITLGYFPENQSLNVFSIFLQLKVWHAHDSVTYPLKCDLP